MLHLPIFYNSFNREKAELEVSNELEFFMRKAGATASSFDTIVASGVRSALPHGVATDKLIEKGDLVTMDFGALLSRLCVRYYPDNRCRRTG